MSRNRIFRFGLIAFLALAMLFAAGVLVVRSRAFHRYLLATISSMPSRPLEDVLSLATLRSGCGDCVPTSIVSRVHGTEPDPQAPLFRADRLAVGLTLVSVWRRKIDVQEIVLDHPVVHLWVDEQGHTNIPQTPPTSRNRACQCLRSGHWTLCPQ